MQLLDALLARQARGDLAETVLTSSKGEALGQFRLAKRGYPRPHGEERIGGTRQQDNPDARPT
jgi:hypothetical protein